MLDFLMITTRSSKHGVIEVFPKFRVTTSSDLMIRGGDFYAVWNEDKKLWDTSEDTVIRLIDKELDRFAKDHRDDFEGQLKVLYMWDGDTGMIDKWHKYVQKQCRDNFHALDETLVFSDTETTKEDYASRKLGYPLKEGSIEAYEELISTLYSPEERHKIEWAIGSIVSGESKHIQKFMVLYGSAGTGKSTILNIIQSLFDGYYSVFDAKALGMNANSFALEAFKSNPLVAIQHDGDLSRIEDNTRLNSIVSHELMTVNEKFKAAYASRFNCFLFLGTNRPVKITDAKSGIIRRLIDVSPTGNKLTPSRYKRIMSQINFELGAIAWHCRKVYLDDPGAYDDYIPISMLGASNDFYNFVLDSFDIFKKNDGVSLKSAWEMYNTYCTEAKVPYPYPRRIFQEELKNYFLEFEERAKDADGVRVRNYYRGFIVDKFQVVDEPETKPVDETWLRFDSSTSDFDILAADYPAQYANDDGIPITKWDNVKTTLKDIDTKKLHYVRVPPQHIVIDFDLKDENGNKSFERNLKAAEKWPKTYAELSKSGQGIHLHYIYDGDIEKLSRLYDVDIEVKIFTGLSSLRRLVSRCTNLPIAPICSGLPMKGDDKVVDFDGIKSEKHLRALILKSLRKETHSNTKPCIDLIAKNLEDAYNSGMDYDISDMIPIIQNFASNSSHQANNCLRVVKKMHFASEVTLPDFQEIEDPDKLTFFDVEVFPNLFVVVFAVGDADPISLINPTAKEIELLCHGKLVGFNNRKYDNHILYGRLMNYDNEMLYDLSQGMIQNKTGFFGKAYNLSYTDIYDFASAGNKMSLKKWEIELGIHHQELGLPWDEPVPEKLWPTVAEYCINDVVATRAVFNHLKGDWDARLMLAAMAGMTPNDTTNSLTTKIIFGDGLDADVYYGRKPNPYLVYTDLATGRTSDPEYQRTDLLGAFPGYESRSGVNWYRNEDVGMGGYVYAEPGMYGHAITFDVASMHPSSILAMNLFGKFTARFREIFEARIAIKHKDFDKASSMLGGVLAPYLGDKNSAKAVANALKTAINSVYGLTAASFGNPFRDERNINNIVALRGALFMVNLKHEVQSRGYTVIHVKTDSIKIANPDADIFNFVMEYGRQYGYNFEVEHEFEKICLVNNAVYIAKLAETDVEWISARDGAEAKGLTPPTRWTATGAQFQHPYIFKYCFSKEPIKFRDMWETKTVTSQMYLDINEHLPEDEHNYVFVGRAGAFCPMKPGSGGGELVKSKDRIKYDAVVGTKGYRWMECEKVEALGKQDDIDISYYAAMVDKAVEAISKFGDYESFVA